jgi:hypothetical protein
VGVDELHEVHGLAAARGVVWVKPKVVVEVMGRLRDPVLRAVVRCGIAPTGPREK